MWPGNTRGRPVLKQLHDLLGTAAGQRRIEAAAIAPLADGAP